jgi:uncharacterized protein
VGEYIYTIRSIRAGFADGPNEEEIDAMTRHFGYLRQLLEAKTLLLAGPCLDRAFGVAIFEADSIEEARRIMESDPSVASGVMRAELHEFRVSLLQKEYVPLRERVTSQ